MYSLDHTSQGDIGDDAVVQIISDDVAIIENIDVFTPIHDDPVVQGEIVACNATNDVFAMGASTILSMQAFLGVPSELPEEIIVGVLRGMRDFMKRLGSRVTGGQTIKNPVPVFGGVCMGITHPSNVVYSCGAQLGDVVLLTKPLGIQPAMKSYRALKENSAESLLNQFDESSLLDMQESAVCVMTHSNHNVALAMNEVGVNAATDITGFGLLGHASNVGLLSGVSVKIHSVPVIKGSLQLAKFFGHRLAEGYGAETAGGMLVFVNPEKEQQFVDFLKKRNLPCWSVGEVIESQERPSAFLSDDVEYIETDFQ